MRDHFRVYKLCLPHNGFKLRVHKHKTDISHLSNMNAPSRSDAYLLPEGAQKVMYEKDTKISNAGKFTILREDHTMGNLIRMCVLDLELST